MNWNINPQYALYKVVGLWIWREYLESKFIKEIYIFWELDLGFIFFPFSLQFPQPYESEQTTL